MKKSVICLLLFVVSFFGISNIQAVSFSLSSENVILYHLDHHKVLYEKNADERISIASMTKIMTAIVAIENMEDIDAKVQLTSADFYGLEEANASVAGFEVGQNVTYRDLLYGLLLPSGADAALALTRTVAGNRETFIALMNEKAQMLGLKNTHFVNETGLDEDGHYSTVAEVAQFFAYALQNEIFAEIIQQSSYTMSDDSFTVYSTMDKGMQRYGLDMDYLLGGKTGTTYDAGLCLASFAQKDGIHYLLVTARAPYNAGPKHLLDAQTIYEYFMSHYGNQTILEKGDLLLTLKTQYAKEESISFYAKQEQVRYLSKEFDKQDLQYEYHGIDIISYDTKPYTKLGTLEVKYQGETLETIDIILEDPLHFSLGKYFANHKEVVFGSIGVFFLFMILVVIVWRKKKRM